MTYHDAWIGPPDEIVCLADGQKPETNGPADRISPLFPEGREAFFALMEKIKAGKLLGVQTDWGSYAALVTRAQIEAFVDEIFGPPGAYEARHDDGLKHMADKMRELRAFIATLPDDAKFALAADEF